MKIFNCLFFTVISIMGQTVYEIPFGSAGNEIELEVINDSKNDLNNVRVHIVEKPDWVIFNREREMISELKLSQNINVLFKCDIEKEAPILEKNTLIFQIISNRGIWNKEIIISILPPEKFELKQNYPNPFNPSTTISYLIPSINGNLSHDVHLAVYDIIGRHLITLVKEIQDVGYHEIEWNAANYASGIYIYQLSIKGTTSRKDIIRKKMMLMK